jgi:predicted dehydrogenase
MTERKPVTVGFIGAGNVLPAYLQLLDRLVPRGLAAEGPICVRRRAQWRGLRARRPHAQLVSDPLDVVTSDDVDVVVIITPPDSHAELCRLALRHGRHVVVEKPLATSRREAQPLVKLAAKQGVHLVAAPFVHLSPTFQELLQQVRGGAIGRVHSARALYGNAGVDWASWYHESGIGPLAEIGIYNLKSLTTLLGPVREVFMAEATAVDRRRVQRRVLRRPDPDTQHVMLRHADGALSSVVAGYAIQQYRRPALELYGTEGTAYLLGDDWSPQGMQLWRNAAGRWEEYEPVDDTWLWTDGLREIVMAVQEGRAPLANLEQDLHLLDVVDAATASLADGRPVKVKSTFTALEPAARSAASGRHKTHDRTRPADEQ